MKDKLRNLLDQGKITLEEYLQLIAADDLVNKINETFPEIDIKGEKLIKASLNGKQMDAL